MSMDLVGAGGKFSMGLPSWHFALELGCRYGWLPAGTEPPDDEDDEESILDDDEAMGELPEGCPWDYVTNAGRKVNDEDARQWADALEQALPDLPDHDATAHKPFAYPVPAAMAPLLRAMPGPGLPDPSQYVRALEWFSGPRKQTLRDFIAFCHRGGFAV